jgi:hypothetical protein
MFWRGLGIEYNRAYGMHGGIVMKLATIIIKAALCVVHNIHAFVLKIRLVLLK